MNIISFFHFGLNHEDKNDHVDILLELFIIDVGYSQILEMSTGF